MGVRIVVGEREPIGQALKRLRRSMQAEGVSWEMRRRRYFVPAAQDRRAKRFQKRFKARQATLLAQRAGEQPAVCPPAEAAAEFWRRTGKP
jgi:ribosomal protein S21